MIRPNDSAPDRASDATEGLLATLRSALWAALTTGLLFGIVDAFVADARTHPPYGLAGYLGCFAAAVLSYSLVHGAALVVAGALLHPILRRRSAARRFGLLLAIGLCAGLFLELYWWTRPYLFYGHSSVSPERLATAAGLAVAALALGAGLAALLVRLPRPVHVAARCFALLAMAGGALFIGLERQRVAARGQIDERNRDLPNILLVVVDALRADVLGCYGNERVKTPFLDGLARDGVLFENCLAQAPYTWTSFGSILTGKYPRRHGLVTQRPGVRMVQTNVTLPYHLKRAQREDGRALQDDDYATGTFMTGALSHGSGLDRGFDVYTEAMMGHDIVEVESQWSVFRSELLLWIFKNKIQQRMDFGLVVTLARRWLRQNADRRWMAMVHLYSTHTPYDPPEEFRRMYVDPAYDGPIDAFFSYHREAIEQEKYPPTEADVQQIRNLYYAGVSQADAMIGELLGELRELEILDETLVIVTADHGEDLGERERCWEHNHMWQTNLRVPLVMANAARLPQGERIGALVESVDILPSVCDLLDLELPRGREGDARTLIDGRSVLPLIGEGGAESIKEYGFTENALYAAVQDRSSKLIVPRQPPHDLLDPALDSEAVFDPAHPVRFYDLARDPHELANLVHDPRAAADVRRLYGALRTWSMNLPVPESEAFTTARDWEQIEMLRKLGYTEFLEEGEPVETPDPEDEEAGGGR